jgi:xanthine dehydrogenase molybdopterin-binding subunit B
LADALQARLVEDESAGDAMSILGTRVLGTEDPPFLTRGGLYTDDLDDERLNGALHVTFVRSPLAHARIVGIDTAEAEHPPAWCTSSPPRTSRALDRWR